jgi:acyl dehydratase
MQFGRCYEEFEVGAVYKHWPGRTITEYDDTLFSMLTMNHNPLHIDAHYAEMTQFKQRLVVGPLIFSLALGMSVADVSGKAIANLEFEHVKHLAPTFHGDTIYAETRVLEKRLSGNQPDRGIVAVETIAYNQRGENVLSFTRKVMVPTQALDEKLSQAREEHMERLRQENQP